MEFLKRGVLFLMLVMPGTGFAQTLEPATMTNGGGSQPATPYASYSNGANVNIQNGNMSLATQDVFIPHPLGFGVSRSTNAGIGPMTLEKFVEVFEGALPHIGIDTRLDGRDTQIVGSVDKIVYENAEIDLGTLGKLKAQMTQPDTRHHNEVSLRVGSPGWNVAWSDYVGVLVLLKTAPNATERPAIVLLINKDGGAEPFDFSTGESLWDKTGSKFTTPFGASKEEVDGLQNLLLQNPDGIQHRFRKVNEGELFYQVYYSFPCDRWSHFSAGFSLGVPLFSFTRKTCHADFRLAGWKIYGFKLNRVEDAQGHFLEIDYMDPQPGTPQNIIDETGRRITRRIDSNNLEEWQTGDRTWRMQFDNRRQLQAATDPEENTTVYKYIPDSAPKRSMGWDSLSQPDKFLEINYPTGGIIRYEWFGQEIPVGEESAGHNTFVIVTEFPNRDDRNVFNQKYHWVNEVTQSSRADGNPAIVSTLYDLDGSVKEHLFTKVGVSEEDKGQWRVTEEKTTANSVSISKRTLWHQNADGKTIDGPERVEVTREGVTYNEAEITYDELGRTTAITNPTGGRTEYRYVSDSGDSKDLASQIRKMGGNGSETIHHVYGGQDPCGRALNERQLNYTFRNINGDEHVVNKYCYDANGNVIRELDGESFKLQPSLQIAFNTTAPPSVGTEQIVYDRNTGWLMQEVDQYGVAKQYTYNKTGNPIRIDFGNGSYIAYVYDVPGRTITTTIHDATADRNVITIKKFDGLGNLIEENEGGAVTRYAYTPTKKLQQMIYPDGRAIQYRYDALGRILEQNLSGHQPIRYSYSMHMQEGAPVQVTQTNISGEPVVKVEHDLSGNLVTLEKYDQNGDAITTHYSYDALGNLLNTQTPEGLSISDAINYSTGEINRSFPGGDAHQFNLYESSRSGKIVHADASGGESTANMRYGASGLLQEIAFPGQSTRLSYGAQGATKNRLSAVQDNAGQTSFAYNAGGAPEKIERSIDALGEKYAFYQVKDSFGNLVRLIYPNGLIVYYKYDGQNRVVEVRKDSESGLVLAKFDYEGGNDQPSRITYSNGVASEYSYDLAGRLIRIDAKKSDGTFIQQDQYGYDNRGRKISVRRLDGSRVRYEYDGLSRLVAARYFKKGETAPSQFQEYTYDKDGNRIRYRDSLKEVQYTYENGKLTGYAIKKENDAIYEGSLNYALGDVTLQKETKLGHDVLEKRFTFDPQHRLTSVEVEDRQTKFKTNSQYKYDYTGRRESVTVDGKTKYYLYGESIDPLMELNQEGEV
ncbi:MAG: hypothetical protein Q7S68_01945, partial [Deltaproteobacteria bacterium]|nr:hypothetical protein [Deltaproteobacteria bacterium]